MPSALVIRTAGTNCDAEMCRAFELAGAKVDLVHVDRLIAEPSRVDRFDLIGFPGGFSYGDDVASGRILAVKLRERLYPALRAAAERGACMIGACNGFQVLVQVGLLPGPSAGEPWPVDQAPTQTVALTHNAGGRFIDKWVRVAAEPDSPCVWTRGWRTLATQFPAGTGEDVMRLPIAHGEGRFVAASSAVLAQLAERKQIALRYVDNPNGSAGDVAGICDATGRIFGLMPHPERYLDWTLHPYATRLPEKLRHPTTGFGGRPVPTPGLAMFRSAVEAVGHVRA